jgi:recombination protein RecA
LKPFLKSEIESGLATRFGDAIKLRERPATEFVSTGLGEIDEMTGGLPRGAISELLGPASSGCTTLLLAALKAATDRDEVFALVDANDSFDPASAASADVDLDQLLWVRCGSDAECALKAVDLLLQSGGFGLVALDLGDISTDKARRIQSSWWHRFRRAIENTPTCLLVIEREPNARSCASLALELSKENDRWAAASGASVLNSEKKSSQASDQSKQPQQVGPACSILLSGTELQVIRSKPIRVEKRQVQVHARAAAQMRR